LGGEGFAGGFLVEAEWTVGRARAGSDRRESVRESGLKRVKGLGRDRVKLTGRFSLLTAGARFVGGHAPGGVVVVSVLWRPQRAVCQRSRAVASTTTVVVVSVAAVVAAISVAAFSVAVVVAVAVEVADEIAVIVAAVAIVSSRPLSFW
jgi:hypothetical protein